jgi:hypothetical protein
MERDNLLEKLERKQTEKLKVIYERSRCEEAKSSFVKAKIYQKINYKISILFRHKNATQTT